MTGLFGKTSLATKITVLTLGALLLLALTVFVVSTRIFTANATRAAEEAQEANMRVAWSVLHKYGADFRRDGDTIYVGDKAINGWNEPVDEVKQLVGGTATVFSGDTRVATNVMKDDGTRAVGTKLARNAAYDAVLVRGEPYRGQADILGKPFFTAYDPIKNKAGETIGVLYVGLPKDSLIADLHELEAKLGVAVALVTLIMAALTFILANRMFRPLGQLSDAMGRIGNGDTEIVVPARERGDEVGRMAASLEGFRQAAIAKRSAEAQQAKADAERQTVLAQLGAALARIEHGKLTTPIDTPFPPAFEPIRHSYNSALESLSTLVGEVKRRAGAIRTGSEEITHASEDLARRTEANAASIEETSAAATQINERLRSSAQSAGDTVARAGQAGTLVKSGRQVTDAAVQAMQRVSESARGIDDVIEGLDKIAFQTRVLAMNAAVEAGRAGEAGAGFAQVADLVSALAMRAETESSRAREQLSVTQSEIEIAVGAVGQVDGALVEIVEGVSEVNRLVSSMADDNQAQGSAVSQVTSAIGTLESSTQQNAAMVEQTSAAARNLLGDVQALAEAAERFETARSAAVRGAPAQSLKAVEMAA